MGLRRRRQEEPQDDFDSGSSSESETVPVVKEKSRKPADNAFRQQRLKAYHPILTPKTIIPLLLLLAVIFIPLGGGMLYGSRQIEELIIDYTQCENEASSEYYSAIPTQYVDSQFHTNSSVNAHWKLASNDSETYEDERGLCKIQFTIPNDIGPPVFMFYKLKNFYANHRRYVQSFSEDQLNGKVASTDTIKNTAGQNCKPLTTNHEGKKYYPCGLIANSLFNDTFSSPLAVNGTEEDYSMTNEGIAWSTDKNRFKKTKYNVSEIVPPPNWHKRFPDGYTEENLPDISQWPEFQNWMHPSALPLFSKLVLRNDIGKMTTGTYEVTVGLHFPVIPFKGHKYLYISTRSVIGAKNSFLGIAWIVAGGICLILSMVFLIVNMVRPRKTGDLSMLSWNKQEHSS